MLLVALEVPQRLVWWTQPAPRETRWRRDNAGRKSLPVREGEEERSGIHREEVTAGGGLVLLETQRSEEQGMGNYEDERTQG